MGSTRLFLSKTRYKGSAHTSKIRLLYKFFDISKEARSTFDKHDPKTWYSLLHQVFGTKSSHIVPLKLVDPTIKYPEGILGRWTENIA